MMENRKLLLCILSCLCTIAPAVAQRFGTIGVQDGLSDGFIRDIECDSEGYMWFATLDGLNRYDGYHFKKYSLSELGHNADVFDRVDEDGWGRLWMKASSGESYLYDPLTDKLSEDITPALIDAGIHVESIRSIYVDGEKNLWVETPDLICIKYFKRDVSVSVRLPERCSQVATTQGNSYAYLEDGSVWSVYPECRRIEGIPAKGISGIHGEMNGRLWILGESVGFYDTNDQSLTMLPAGIIPDGDFVKCLTETGGNIWLGTDRNGIIVLNERFEKVRTLESDKTQEFTLPSNHINCLFQKNGIIWVGAGQMGVAYSIVNELDIRRFRNSITEAVGTIAEDANGRIYIGFDGKGLMLMEDGQVKPVLTGDYESILGSYLDNENGNLYFGTYGDGVFIWDGSKASPVSTDPEFLSITESCRYFTKDFAGRLWIATFNNGLVRLERDGGMKHFTTTNSALESKSISSMTGPGKDGTLYVSNRHRLYYISPTTQEIVPMETNLRQITQLFLDGRGILWVGTTEGLYYLDREGTPVPVTTEEGLADDHIQGICEDRYGNIWVMSEEGFTNIFVTEDPSSGGILLHCYPYFEEDGIGKGQFTRNAIFCTSGGDVLMGNDGDIVAVRPEPYAPQRYEAGVTVTGISISSEPMLPPVLKGTEPVLMKHHDNLSIEVSTLDFRNKRALFEYRIDGKDDWSLLASNILFIKTLNPGSHLVEIRPVNVGQSGPAAQVRVKVKPPFYKSTLAYCLYAALLGGGILLLLYMFRSRKRRRIEKERMRMEEAKLQFFTNISHDLRTPLAMIIAPLDNLIHRSDGQSMSRELEQIDRNARVLLDEIDQILDFKQLNGTVQAYRPTYGNIARFVSETCRTYAEIVQPEDAELTIDTGSAPVMTDFDRDKVRRILHNLLGNAFKYRKKDGKAVVSVTVREEDGQAVIRVTDNGPGISDKGKERIFERFFREAGKGESGSGIGLNIVQEFVRMHEGTVSVADNQPSGCIFTVSIPIRSETAAPAATAVPWTATGLPRILNVEDNPDFRAFITEELSSSYDVTEAGNGREALEILGQDSFDLILSDVVMPEMDGHALCRAVRSDIRLSGIPIILMTAVHGKDAELESLKAGADDTLMKPFDVETLLLRIENILKRKGAGAESQAGSWKGSREDRDLLDRINSEISEHLQESDYTVEALSSSLNMSRSVLYKRLIMLTDKPPVEYIREIRLRKGREMIENGETSISQIAWSVGYSPKQFSRHFKDEYGCLPSEYLRHLKK